MERRCDKCEWWVKHPGYDNQGQCHRNSPVAFRSIPGEDSPFGVAIWPMVNEGSWCGEFKAKLVPVFGEHE